MKYREIKIVYVNCPEILSEGNKHETTVYNQEKNLENNVFICHIRISWWSLGFLMSICFPDD